MKPQIETQIRTLSSLLENLREGYIQVPPFQRRFVWDRTKILDLFDSIRKSYPIGSILIWKPRENQPWEYDRQVGGFTLPNLREPKAYVLDGSQRLSSLFGCLTNPCSSGMKYDDEMRKKYFNLYFDLREENFIYPASTPKAWQVPVYTLTSTSEFRQYTRNVLEPAVSDSGILDLYLDRADAFSRILADYKLAVIEVGGACLDDAVNIFSRINSKGTEITKDWMVNALSFNRDFNFSYEVDKVIGSLEAYNFAEISRDTIFRCYQSAFDDILYLDADIEVLAKRSDFVETVGRMSKAIVKAVEFMFEELNVIEAKLLPYQAQLVFLSVFFMREPKIDRQQAEAMKHWFWFTTYYNYFTRYSPSKQRKAFRHLHGYINGNEPGPLYLERPEKSMRTLPWPRRQKLSNVRCIALVLFQLDHLRRKTNISPYGNRLVTKKYFKTVDTIPENMIVSYSTLPITPHLSDLFFTPDVFMGSTHDLLASRKHKLQEAERYFVESLGLEYN